MSDHEEDFEDLENDLEDDEFEEDEVERNAFDDAAQYPSAAAFVEADEGDVGQALAKHLHHLLTVEPDAVDEIPLWEALDRKYANGKCLFFGQQELADSTVRRNAGRYRAIHCISFGLNGLTWSTPSLEEQIKSLMIYLYGTMLSKVKDRGQKWSQKAPKEIVIITDEWTNGISEWVPMLEGIQKMGVKVSVFLVTPFMCQSITV
jgi:hypothetical protein